MPFAAASSSFLDPSLAVAADNNNNVISTGSLDPSGFVPVCPTSDGFYRLLQGTAEALVGRDAFVEYGPLIAGGLLRVRLELCVIESFLNEAVVPFVKQNGVSWILPLHETVETFLAGTIFALAATFILIGSTKIVTIIATYADFLIGFPCRLLGGFSYDRALGKPVTLDVGISPFKTRLVGPPLVEGNASDNSKSWEDGDGKGGQQDDSDWSKLGVGNIVPVVVSGSVKSVGIVLGVRVLSCSFIFLWFDLALFCFLFSPARLGTRFAPTKITDSFDSSFGRSWTVSTCSWEGTWCSGRRFTS
jgi:hypothetical protein